MKTFWIAYGPKLMACYRNFNFISVCAWAIDWDMGTKLRKTTNTVKSGVDWVTETFFAQYQAFFTTDIFFSNTKQQEVFGNTKWAVLISISSYDKNEVKKMLKFEKVKYQNASNFMLVNCRYANATYNVCDILLYTATKTTNCDPNLLNWTTVDSLKKLIFFMLTFLNHQK